MKEATPNFYKVVITLRLKLSKDTQQLQKKYISLLFYNIVIVEIVIGIMQDKEAKGTQIRREIKLSLFADYISYKEKPKTLAENL